LTLVCAQMNDRKTYPEIGERLRRIREGFTDDTRRAWSARQQFNETQYNNWEAGLRRIPVEAAERLCDRYGLTLDFIYRGRMDGLSENAKKVL
jgi:transcriptional regulator with XRE-family HTH domain